MYNVNRNDEHIQKILKVIESQKTDSATSKPSQFVKESSISNDNGLDPTFSKVLEEVRNNKNKKNDIIKENRKFKTDLKSYLVESWLDYIVQNSLKNRKSIMTESTINLGKSLIKSFVTEEGVQNILDNMSTKSVLLADAAYTIENMYTEASGTIVDDKLNKIDTNTAINKIEDTKAQFFEDISNSDDYDMITSAISDRVSQATQDFIQKNMIDKMDIQDMMNTTKDKIASVRTGNPEVDEEIKQEQTVKLRNNIKKKDSRPHSVYEQIVINLTHDVICNESAKQQYTNNQGKIDMDSIVEKATMFYTVLETVNTLRLRKINEEYIKESIEV